MAYIKVAKLEQCVNDPCLFVSFKHMIFVGIHTDDALVVAADTSLQHFKKEFDKRFPVKFLGFPKLWCGLQMERFQDGSIKFSMETFTRKLLEKFWQGKINSSYSPLGLDKLCDDDPPDTDNYPVRPAIGNFIWLAINLRFDIAPAVNVIACRQTKPSAKLSVFSVTCQRPPILHLSTRVFPQHVPHFSVLQTAPSMLTPWEAMLGFLETL